MTDLYVRDLVPIVELQALELKRLMRDKERLNEKVDSLIREIGSMRLMQQQDQTLRAREQDLRALLQQALTDLVSRSSQTKEGAPTRPDGKLVVGRRTGLAKAGGDPEATKVADEGAAGASEAPGGPERMEIPAFLANGPRVGFDHAVADDIREIHGPGGATGEAPIKKLLARIRARNGTR